MDAADAAGCTDGEAPPERQKKHKLQLPEESFSLESRRCFWQDRQAWNFNFPIKFDIHFAFGSPPLIKYQYNTLFSIYASIMWTAHHASSSPSIDVRRTANFSAIFQASSLSRESFCKSKSLKWKVTVAIYGGRFPPKLVSADLRCSDLVAYPGLRVFRRRFVIQVVRSLRINYIWKN